MFGGQTIVNRNNKRRDFTRETAANGVVGHRGSAEESESTSVKENDDGSGAGGGGGREETEPEISGGVDLGVEGGNGVDWFRIGRNVKVQEVE